LCKIKKVSKNEHRFSGNVVFKVYLALLYTAAGQPTNVAVGSL
jgi:hypothetical protein